MYDLTNPATKEAIKKVIDELDNQFERIFRIEQTLENFDRINEEANEKNAKLMSEGLCQTDGPLTNIGLAGSEVPIRRNKEMEIQLEEEKRIMYEHLWPNYGFMREILMKLVDEPIGPVEDVTDHKEQK